MSSDTSDVDASDTATSSDVETVDDDGRAAGEWRAPAAPKSPQTLQDRHGLDGHVPVSSVSAGSVSDAEVERLRGLAANARSAATRRAYASDWHRWERWCVARNAVASPAEPELVAVYLEEHAAARTQAGQYAYAPPTLTRWVSTLNQVSRAAGHPAPGEHPLVQAVLSAIRRTREHRPRRREPLLLDDLSQICSHTLQSGRHWAARVATYRDVALFTTGFFGGFRRDELSQLTLADITYQPGDGLHVRLRQSKTDQEATGQVKALPFRDPPHMCPVCAIMRWGQVIETWNSTGRSGLMRLLRMPHPAGQQELAGHVCDTDPVQLPRSNSWLFQSLHRSGTLRGQLSGHGINLIIQRRAKQAGIDPERLKDFGGHSLRAGLVTEGYRAGATAEEIAQQTGHHSLQVLAGYRREHAPLQGNAVTRIGHAKQSGGEGAEPDDSGGTDG